MTPGQQDLWFVPLGGCGEIGMNLNLFGHDRAWLMVDCGISFERDAEATNARGDDRIVMADPGFIEARAGSLVGIVATHAHEDHIGALPDLWSRFPVPIYTTPFTAHVLRRKMAEARVEAPIVTVDSGTGETIDLAPFRLRWLPITHSTPETHALLISTRAGQILHTADWKIDPDPVVGTPFDANQFQSLGDVDAIVCDSTNATKPGHSVSEGEVATGLLDEIRSHPGRVVVACFASNVARLQTLSRIANQTGRYVGLLGRTLKNMTQAAAAAGHLGESFRPAEPDHLGYLPRNEVLAIASGSQGEIGSALHRLALDTHPALNLVQGDKVIFSAKTIPGNEDEVARMIRRFHDRGIEVVHADERETPLHASGHPCEDELRNLYGLVRPRIAIPVHGEDVHMARNAEIAEDCGVARTLVGRNGDLFRIAGDDAPAVETGCVPTGRLRRTSR